MGEAEWHYAIGDREFGPVDSATVRGLRESGELGDDAVLWRDGMEDWQPFAAVAHEFARASASAGAQGEGSTPYESPHSPARVTRRRRQGGRSVRTGAYRDPSVRARVVLGFFAFYTLSTLAFAFSSYLQYQLLAGLRDGAFDQGDYNAAAEANDIRHALLGLLNLVALLGCVISWCFWKHRVATNAAAFGTTRMSISPGWAVGWYFIPFANLVKPFEAMKEIWRASAGPDTGGAGLCAAWWALWIISNVVSNISARLGWDLNDLDSLITSSAVDVGVGLLELISITFAILVIRRLTEMQRERWGELGQGQE